MLFNTKDSSTVLGAITQSRQKNREVNEYQDIINNLRETKNPGESFFATNFLELENYSDNVKKTIDDIQKKAQDAGKSGEDAIIDIEVAMEETSNEGTKLGATFKNIGLSIVNGLASAAISAVITWLIGQVADLIDELIITQKEAENLSNQFADTFSSNERDQSKAISDLSKIEEEYSKLSEGVNALGENVSLTDEQFERYNELTSIIAENMPGLIQGYSDQGTAIINLKNNVKDLTEAYKENQKIAAQNLYEQKDEDGKHTVIQGVYENAKQHMADASYSVMDDDHTRYAEEMGYSRQVTVNIEEQIAARKKLAEASQEELIKIFKGNASYEKELLLNEYQYTLDDIKNKYDELNSKFKTDSTKFESMLQNDATRIAQAGLTNVRAYGNYYTDLATDRQKYVDAVINSLDFDFMKENNLFDETKMNEYAAQVVETFVKLSDKDFEDLQFGVNLTTQWNNDELTYEEYIKKIQELGKLLEKIFPNKQIQESIKLLFDIPDEEELESKQDIFVNRFGKAKNLSIDTRAVKTEIENIDKELERMQKKGSVNLKLRPEIDTEELRKAGWDEIEDDIATIYSSTFSNEDETKWINFTPIIVDPKTGEYKGVLSPEELQDYAEGVINGTRTDDLNLQIGGEFDTEEQAVAAAEKIHTLHERLSDLRKDVDKYGSKSVAGMPSDVENRLKSQGTEVADSWYDSLTKSQQEFVDNLSDEDLAEAVRFESTEEFDEWLDRLMTDADGNLKIKPNAAELVKDLNNLESKWNTLNSALDTASTGETLKASTIQGVTDAFGGVGKDSEGNINALSAAVEDYNKKLVENPGNVEVAVEASNNLATASLDLTGALEELIDKDEEYAKQVLEDQRVKNAEEVVQSRLNSTYKATRANLEKLAKTMATYRTELEKSNKTAADFDTTEGQEGQFSQITKDVADLLGEYDKETGKLLNPADIDGQFIADNWGLVQDAIEGVDGSLDQLYIKLAMVNARKVMVEAGLDDSEIDAKMVGIQEMLNVASTWTMEPQALLENSQFMAGLNNCWDGTEETVNAINAALGTIGMKVQYKTTPKKIMVPVQDATASNSKGTQTYKNGKPTMQYWRTEPITVDDFEIVSTSTGKGTVGKGVNLSPTPTTSGGSPSSGGGDKGSSPSEKNWEVDEETKKDDIIDDDTKEEFDWIEIKIKNIEKEISNLNREASDTFSTWGDRTKALNKQLSKTVEEIKAQETASRHYNEYANKVKINDGKKLKRSDYGYSDKEYKSDLKKLKQSKDSKHWNNGNNEWVNKILAGKADEIEIDKIKNPFTNQAIKRAVATYNKYIDKETGKIKEGVKLTREQIIEKVKNPIFKKGSKVKFSDFKITKDMYTDNPSQYYYDIGKYKEGQKIWKSGKYQKLVREGKIGYEDIEKIDNKFVAEAIKAYKEWYDKSDEAKEKTKELQQQLKELNKQKFDNIKEQYTELVNLIAKKVELIDEKIATVQEKGYVVDKAYYKKQLNYEKSNLKKLQAERKSAYKQFIENVANGTWAVGSTEYNSALESIRAIDVEIQKSATNTAKLNNEIKQLQWDKFDYLWDRLSDINKEAEMFINIFSSEKTMDEFGAYNNRGWAKMAMIGTEYNLAAEKMNKYKKERQKFEKTMDWNNQDDVEHWRKLAESEREATNDLMNYKNEIKNTVQESINAHLNKLKELMDKYKSTLSAAKDLYSYQKNVENQTKQIANLRKQLVAYQSDDSEAGRKRRQELTNQLNSAEQQLQETEWDRYINQTGQILDNLYNNYSKELNKVFDDIDKLVKNELAQTNKHIDDVKDAFSNANSIYGVSPTLLKSYIDGKNDNLIATLGKEGAINTNLTAIGTAVKDIKTSVNKMYEYSEAQAKKSLEAEKEKKKNEDEEIKNAKEAAKAKKADEKAKKKIENQLQKTTENADAVKTKTEESNLVQQIVKYVNKLMKDSSSATKKKVINAVTKKYAKGTRKVSNDELAWTQDAGSELIYRTTDGAILTPLGAGDMVFTNEMSKRLWEIASGDLPSSVGTTKVPNISSNNQSTINLDNQISISLPNVKDYDSFKKELQNDSRFEKFIQEVTLGQAMGNNKLNKRKY